MIRSARKKLAGSSEADLTVAYQTGMEYFRGGGLRIDHNKAFEHFRQAAERGLPEAQAELAALYCAPGIIRLPERQRFPPSHELG